MKARALIHLLFILVIAVGCSSQDNSSVQNSSSKNISKENISFGEEIEKAHEFLMSRDIDNAISAYENATVVNSSSGKTHYLLGELYFRKSLMSHMVAQRRYLRETMLNPQNAPSPNISDEELSELYEKFGWDRKSERLAMEEFRDAIKYEPDLWMARYYIATDYLNQKQYDRAIPEYEKIIKTYPYYENAYDLLAEAYSNTGNYEKADEIRNKAKELKEDDPGYFFYIQGLLFLDSGNEKKVLEILEEFKKMNSSFFYKALKEKFEAVKGNKPT